MESTGPPTASAVARGPVPATTDATRAGRRRTVSRDSIRGRRDADHLRPSRASPGVEFRYG
ncbi:hypothetical protein BRC93_02810 [Halobacteriales archaeon QS_5_70_15]|nr:MAG: hypothetical protein BRC93_02810 [Halobacteriales archaeon QS_5_70_15]